MYFVSLNPFSIRKCFQKKEKNDIRKQSIEASMQKTHLNLVKFIWEFICANVCQMIRLRKWNVCYDCLKPFILYNITLISLFKMETGSNDNEKMACVCWKSSVALRLSRVIVYCFIPAVVCFCTNPTRKIRVKFSVGFISLFLRALISPFPSSSSLQRHIHSGCRDYTLVKIQWCWKCEWSNIFRSIGYIINENATQMKAF